MNRRQFLTTSAATMVQPAAPPKAPNILFLMTDQHRFDVLGANGNREVGLLE